MTQNRIYPEYYERFACLAGDCPMTCCQEWEIEVDPKTRKKWEENRLTPARSLVRTAGPDASYATRSTNTAAAESTAEFTAGSTTDPTIPVLSDSLEQSSGGRRKIRLSEDHRCPWLEESGLCRVVLTYGEEMLSHTCHVYPRLVRHGYGPEEHGLYNSCPAVLDLLKERERFQLVQHTEKSDFTPKSAGSGASDTSEAIQNHSAISEVIQDCPESAAYSGASAPFNPCSMVRDDRLTPAALLAIRDGVCSLLSDERFTPEQGLMTAFLLLSELWEKEDVPGEAAQILQTLRHPEEYLLLYEGSSPAAADSGTYTLPPFSKDSFLENNELFLDLCQKHHDGGYYRDILEPLWETAEKFNREASALNKAIAEIHREASSSSDSFSHVFSDSLPLSASFLHSFLTAECYNELLPEKPDLTAMIQHLEWIMVRYTAIRHSCLLSKISAGKRSGDILDVSEEWRDVRDIFCVLSRITACTDHDVEEYLSSMFDDPIWNPGYALLLLGISR